jgi:hypothetical protein
MPPRQRTEPADVRGPPSMPRQPAQQLLAQPTELTGPSAEFWTKLGIPDKDLACMNTETYKDWLKVMFRGIAWLGYNRLQRANPEFRQHKQKSFDIWCTNCDPEVLRTAPDRYKDKVASFLRTKESFQYLARVLDENSEDWYLVSGWT